MTKIACQRANLMTSTVKNGNLVQHASRMPINLREYAKFDLTFRPEYASISVYLKINLQK